MKKPIPFKGYITFEDALRVEKLLVPRKLWSTEGVMTICVVAGIAFIVLGMQESLLFSIMLFLGGTGFLIGGPLWWFNRSDRKSRRQRYESLMERNGILREDFIEIRVDKVRSEYQWEFYDKLVESQDLMILAQDKEYQAFAPYMFASQEDWKSCKQMIGGKRFNYELEDIPIKNTPDKNG